MGMPLSSFFETLVLLEVRGLIVGSDWLVFEMTATPPLFRVCAMAWPPSIITTPSPVCPTTSVVPRIVLALTTRWMIDLLLFRLTLMVAIFQCQVLLSALCNLLINAITPFHRFFTDAVLMGSTIRSFEAVHHNSTSMGIYLPFNSNVGI